MNNDKHIIVEEVGDMEIESCKLESMIEYLENFRSYSSKGTVHVIPRGGYSGYERYTIELTRHETDEEYNIRLQNEKKLLEKKEKNKIESLLKKQNLTNEEKESLIEYIRNK